MIHQKTGCAAKFEHWHISQQKEENKQKRKQKKKERGKPDPITLIDDVHFTESDLVFSQSEVPSMMVSNNASTHMNPMSMNDFFNDNDGTNDDITTDANTGENTNSSVINNDAPPNDVQPAPSAFDMDDDVASDALKEILTGKIGLKIETAEIIVHDNEFTCLVDIIDCKESDFEQMGFPKGGRKRIMRKLMTFAKANGVGSNGGNKDGNKPGNGDNVLEQLVQILTKQNDKKNVNPVEGDKNVVVQKQQKLWSKQGNRKCYLGKITKLEIYAYNGLCLRIIMLSLETQDASMIRKKLFEKTRCGAMDRVRCSFENNEWKHSNMTAVRQTIVLLDDMKVVQIVSEEQYGDKYTDWQCTFRRNQISGFMYAQKTLDDAKTVWKWMRKTREYGLCWATYAKATKDSTAARLGLISSQPPDWAKFMAWKQSKPEIYKPMPSNQ